MHSVETVMKCYEIAREELVHRIGLRDNAVYLFLGSVGVICGVALGAQVQKAEILLLIPYLALGAALLVTQHHEIIGSLASYSAEELAPILATLEPGGTLPLVDNSAAMHDYIGQAMRWRAAAHSLLLLGPALFGVAVNYKHLIQSFPYSPSGWLAYFGVVCFVLSALLLHKGHRWRNTVNARFQWQKRPSTTVPKRQG